MSCHIKCLLVGMYMLLIACTNNEKFDNPFTQCNALKNEYSGENIIDKWDKSTSHNDTSSIFIYFDTLKYSLDSTINSITYTAFNNNINYPFNWKRYINEEKKHINTSFELLKSGKRLKEGTIHYWFLADDTDQSLYIEYIKSDPLQIKTLATSNTDSTICELYYMELLTNQIIFDTR